MITTAGSTNVSVYYYIVQDASATSPGEPVTGLLFSDIETGGSASSVRQGAARVDLTLITLASASATHADGGFILVDDTNMPGLYRCDYPDAAFATGVDQAMLQIVVAAGKNAVASPIFVDLTDKIGFALSSAANTAIADLILPPTNTAFDDIQFLFVSSGDHVTPVTGASGTAVTRSIDGAAFGSGTGTLAEIANGIYQYDASAADVNGKIITFRFTGTGGTPAAPDDRFVTVVMSV